MSNVASKTAPGTPAPHPRLRDYAPMALATLFWATPTLFIRYIRRETGDQFSVDAMNAYRYATGTFFCVLLVAAWRPRDFIPVLKKPWIPALLALFLALFQVIWVRGVCLVSAPYSTLVGRSSLLFNLLFVFLLFKDERHLIRSPRFLITTGFCLAAVAGIALADPAFSLQGANRRVYAIGTLLLLAAAVLWSAYTVFIRRFAPHLPSAATFAITCLFCTLFLFIPAGHGDALRFPWSPACPGRVIAAVLASGVLCIASTQMLFYASLKRIGVVRSSLIALLTPFLTGVFSVATLGEVLTPLQWMLGAALAGGLAFIIARSPAQSHSPEKTDTDDTIELPDPAG